ncbi:uncharacterized protein KY384_003572 [Bacidia gigantensis]|uniref:uncharacterized protein n=1 Tax=Bacidia gigantensis TaxID=2732470 RepID=UPI001D056A03|nr:uncharacterized protein KY384_003572 [Bacidia gigantensis]KAG8531936.1 hypothetical protein KY384_003572 [Bacidia gigantensis]
MNVTDAHNFEQSYRAHSSVLDDPFYTVPPESAYAAAGSLLKVEVSTNTSLYTLPPNLSLSRFMYQSKKSNGSLVPVSGYILWPYAAKSNNNKGYPMVAWAHGTSGSAAECAPSNIQFLWHQFQAPYQLALNGYVVVATDYAGLGVSRDAAGQPIVHEYLNRAIQATDLYYSIPAAQQAFPELSREFIAAGQSQGGGTVWSFAQKVVSEPLPGHLGTVALSPGTSLFDLPTDQPIIKIVLLYLVPNLRANYPDFNPTDIFTPVGMQSLQTLTELQGCSNLVSQLIESDILKQGWQNNLSIQEFNKVSTTGTQAIGGPMLVLQGEADPVVNAPKVEAAINDTITKFPDSQIEFHLMPNVTHAPIMYAGLPIYLQWISSRFAGEPVKAGFQNFTATLARPTAIYEADANWFIQKQSESYQVA